MATKPEKKPTYELPSQRLIRSFNDLKAKGEPADVITFNTMIALATLDKLEEVSLILRSFMPRPIQAKPNVQPK